MAGRRSDQSDKDEQRGMMLLFQGTVFALRHPRAHKLVDGGLARRGAGVRCTHQSAGETARTGQGRQEAMRRRATCPVLAPFDATRSAAIGFDPMTTGQQIRLRSDEVRGATF